MPPNVAQQPTEQKPDDLDALIRRYLTKEGKLNEEALEVVQRWHVYLNTLTNSIANQLRQEKPIGIEMVELAFETPIAGFQGNLFWQQHGHSILPMVQRDVVTHHVMMNLSKDNPDLIFALNVLGQFTFIGLVISIVQRDGLASWKSFEVEYRDLLAVKFKEFLTRG